MISKPRKPVWKGLSGDPASQPGANQGCQGRGPAATRRENGTGQMLPGEGTEETHPKGLGTVGQGLDVGSRPLHRDSFKPEGAEPASKGWRRRGQAARAGDSGRVGEDQDQQLC